MSTLRDTGRWLAVLLVAAATAVATPSGAAGRTPWPTHGWPRATPAAVGLEAAALAGLDADFASGRYALVDSFQVFRCGAEVFAGTYPHDYATIYGRQAQVRGPLNPRLVGPYNYFDPAWHPYYRGTGLHTMQSITKTVTSVILGIAITRGDFKARLDTPVLRYFDDGRVQHVDDRKRRLRLEDVLTMRTGLEWNEDVAYDDPRNDASLMEASADWVRYVIDKPMAAEPGTRFNYSSGATELLAYIFRKETGQDIEAYAQRQLFGPLGIRYHWKRYRGLVDTEGGLFLSGTDLAKIGYLYLHDGQWAGRRLVSSDWVRQSLTPVVDTGCQGLKYGYQWWLYPRKDGGRLVWMGIGFGGQRLMVFPEAGMIATVTGWDILKDAALDAELAERLAGAVSGAACSGPER